MFYNGSIMDLQFQEAEDFSNQLHYLLSNASQKEQEVNVENFFRQVLKELTTLHETLWKTIDVVEDRLEEKSVTPDELWNERNFRSLETLPDFNEVEVKHELARY